MKISRAIALVLLAAVLLLLPIFGRWAAFYTRPEERPEVVRPSMNDIQVPTPPAAPYGDEVAREGDGLVWVDMAHDNQLTLAELGALAGRLAVRGHQLRAWTGGDLADDLRDAGALIVAVPLATYELDEIEAIQGFVAHGGRLLLVGDPTRYRTLWDDWGSAAGIDPDVVYLNTLSARYGITFVDDYLYNVVNHEGNFQNIKLSRWSKTPNPLTAGLETVVFYATHSLAVPEDAALVWADDKTWSSATDRAGELVVAAQAADGRVLALGDLTFMTEPYHTVRDNGRFIAQIADFLAGAERSYALDDFPLLFGPETVLVIAGNPEMAPGQLALADSLQELFDADGRTLYVADAADPERDLLALGIYSQPDFLEERLAKLGVTLSISPTATAGDGEEPAEPEDGETPENEEASGQIQVDGVGVLEMSGTALVVSRDMDGRREVLVLASSQMGLSHMAQRLVERDLADCLAADPFVLCPTGIEDEAVEPDWEAANLPAGGELASGPEPDTEPSTEDYTGTLTPGELASGTLAEDAEDRWRLPATAGDVVTLRLEPESETQDLVLKLEDPAGSLLVTADDQESGAEVISGYPLDETGDYVVLVQDKQGEGGDYTLLAEFEAAAGDADSGRIEIGQEVEGELAENGMASWVFSGQADEAVTIVVEPVGDADLILELRNEAGDRLASADAGLYGEAERLEGRLPQDGEYEIRISEYMGDAAAYVLSLTAGGEGGVFGGRGVLIVAADDGTPTAGGNTGADVYADLLAGRYEVILWSLTEDGTPLIDDMLAYELVIWTSGDYQGGGSDILFSYLLDGRSLLLSGAFLSIAEGGETALLRDLQVSDVSSVLTVGLTPGEVIALDEPFDAMVYDYQGDEEGTLPIFLRGPESEQSGDLIAAGFTGDEFIQTKVLIMAFPFYVLPGAIQIQLLDNAMDWFQVSPSP